MTARGRPRADGSALDRLIAEPRRFGFDAAVRLLQIAAGEADPAVAVRFRSLAMLAYPAADVMALAAGGGRRAPEITTTVMGMVGTSGVLPRAYSELVNTTSRGGSRSLHEFLDMLSHRFVAQFARAGVKYRPHRVAEMAQLAGLDDPVTALVLALTGYAIGGMTERLAAGPELLCHYAGFFAMRPRSAERLAAMVSDWCGRPVEVMQFVGAWLPLPREQQTCLRRGVFAGQFDRLGVDAAVGTRAWNAQARIVLRIGPLDLPGFEALLPDRPALRRMVSLIRSFIGIETGFAVNPVLAASSVPVLRLNGESGQLGWNTWLPAERRSTNGTEARFEAELVEAG